ncbi:unnamed protein product [Nesidiocoris tenuis]|uniref:Uncharacterized protein n=1 Tax=Nesidiocoris tenuis TaxID=355587 RepID=A0A6H5GEB4_9HEMI|nr:unnamed protein product [Nesidiocoris tenuis]
MVDRNNGFPLRRRLSGVIDIALGYGYRDLRCPRWFSFNHSLTSLEPSDTVRSHDEATAKTISSPEMARKFDKPAMRTFLVLKNQRILSRNRFRLPRGRRRRWRAWPCSFRPGGPDTLEYSEAYPISQRTCRENWDEAFQDPRQSSPPINIFPPSQHNSLLHQSGFYLLKHNNIINIIIILLI